MAKESFVCKITVLGDRDVGKTALVSQFIWKRFEEKFDPTVEDSYTTSVVINKQECQLEILDTSGAKEFSSLRGLWIRDNEVFVLVYSASSKSSFLRIWEFYNQIQEITKSLHLCTSSPVPMILVGNKVDMTKREVSLPEGAALARELGCEFFEVSAKNGLNVDQAFYTVVKQWQSQRTIGMRVLDSLRGSLHEWNDLVKLVESDIPESAVANTSSLVPSPPLKQNVVARLVRNLRRKTSSPSIIRGQPPSESQAVTSQYERARKVGRGIQPENPDTPLLAGSYNHQAQTALQDIALFLTTLAKKMQALEAEDKFAKLQARVKAPRDAGGNRIVGEVHVEVRDNKEIFQQILSSLQRCVDLCNDASHNFVRLGDCGGTIQEMKKEFSGTIERAKLRFSGDTS